MSEPLLHIDQIRSDDLFIQGLREDSNLAMDWLWLASRVASDGQRRYCVRRALAIYPESELAQRELACLLAPPGNPRKIIWKRLLARGLQYAHNMMP